MDYCTHSNTQKLQLTRDILSTNVAKRAAIARASMRTLPMVNPTKVLGTGVAWICTVSYPHTPRHARCTLLTQPNIHLSAGCWLFGSVYSSMPKRAGTAQASSVPIAPGELCHGARCWCGADVHTLLARARTFMYQAHHHKVKNPPDHGWFEHMAARQAAIAFTKLYANGVEKHRGRAAESLHEKSTLTSSLKSFLATTSTNFVHAKDTILTSTNKRLVLYV